MEEAKTQYENIDAEMEAEIQKTRQILAKLQESKKHFQQIYEATASLLGIEVPLSEEQGEADHKGAENGNKAENRQETSPEPKEAEEKTV